MENRKLETSNRTDKSLATLIKKEEDSKKISDRGCITSCPQQYKESKDSRDPVQVPTY
jgi:hypothetical protein